MNRRKSVIRSALDLILGTQFTIIAQRTGPFTDADLIPFMGEARRIHASANAVTPGPSIDPDLDEWAVMGIAANLLARSRGYDPATGFRLRPGPRPVPPPLPPLSPDGAA